MASNCSLFSSRSGLPSFAKENLIASWNESSDLDAIFQTGSGLRSRDDNKNPDVSKRIIPGVPILSLTKRIAASGNGIGST